MIKDFFVATVYQPLYNALIELFNILPIVDVGIGVILFTVVVKLILLPLSKKAVVTQIMMRQIEPELKAIRKELKDNPQEQAQKIFALYKDREINPFSSIALMLIQLPIIFSLYYIFLRAGFPDINTDLLYSFVEAPKNLTVEFLGLINLSGRSALLAVTAAVTGYYQIKLSMPKLEKREGEASFKDDLARSMNMQMRYIFPVMILFIAYFISGVVALYWTTSNLFMVAQEVFVKRKLVAKYDTEVSE